jgi:hypothetical protein
LLSQDVLYDHTNHFGPSLPDGTTVELHDVKPPTQPGFFELHVDNLDTKAKERLPYKGL